MVATAVAPVSEAPEPERPASPAAVVVASVAVFAGLFGAALWWLSVRDRSAALAEVAVGRHGPLLASAVGLGLGVVMAWLGNAASRRWQGVREVERLAHASLAGVGDKAMVTLVLTGAVAEETFFRLAVQDQFGLFGSVAASVLLNSWLGNVRLTPFVLVHAVALGLVVQSGFGLLGSTTAHAIMNYLTLRRIQCSWNESP